MSDEFEVMPETDESEPPCTECEEGPDFSWHRQTAAECMAQMLAETGRPCANPGEHHLYSVGSTS